MYNVIKSTKNIEADVQHCHLDLSSWKAPQTPVLRKNDRGTKTMSLEALLVGLAH